MSLTLIYSKVFPQTAKAELAKVRLLVCSNMPAFLIADITVFVPQRPFHLETINIQDKGQERWKKRYVYWIPALHLDGEEIAKGLWDAQVVNLALDRWEKGADLDKRQ